MVYVFFMVVQAPCGVRVFYGCAGSMWCMCFLWLYRLHVVYVFLWLHRLHVVYVFQCFHP